MGVLDDLRRQADAARTEAENERVSTESRRARAAETVQPRIQSLYSYFKDLHAHLQVVPPDLVHSYEVTGFGTIANLRQGEYAINSDDDPTRVESFSFHYVCSNEARSEARFGRRASLGELREYLWANNLRFRTRDASGGSTIVSLDNAVPVSFHFEGDYERIGVRLRIRNLEGIGTTLHVFEFDRVDDELMDEIARRVLGKSNRFAELCGNKLSEASRLRLRALLAARRAERAQEAVARAEKSEDSLAAKFSKTFLGRK